MCFRYYTEESDFLARLRVRWLVVCCTTGHVLVQYRYVYTASILFAVSQDTVDNEETNSKIDQRSFNPTDDKVMISRHTQ